MFRDFTKSIVETSLITSMKYIHTGSFYRNVFFKIKILA